MSRIYQVLKEVNRHPKLDTADHIVRLENSNKDLRIENAKLRKEIEAAKHDLSLFSGELVASKLENAKLRELAQDFDKCLDTALCLAHGAGYPVMPDQKLFDSLRPRMRDLGIEVQR